MSTLLLTDRCRPYDDGTAVFAGGRVLFSEGMTGIDVEAFDAAGAPRWRAAFSVPPNTELRPRGCAHVVLGSLLLVHGFAEHARGGTWHLPFFACLDAAGHVRWREAWWVSDSLALRDGILYAAVYVGETGPTARLALRALDLTTGEALLDQSVAVVEPYGVASKSVRFVQDGGGSASDLRLRVRDARGEHIEIMVP